MKLRVQDGVGRVDATSVVGIQNSVKGRFLRRIGTVTHLMLSIL